MIRIKRVYEEPTPEDGRRFLVDRLWPRGKKKEELHIEHWFRDVSPSDDLRHWYGHAPEKWEEFKRRYFAELESKPSSWKPLLEAARSGDITLVYSSVEERLNNAAALKIFLEEHMK